MKMFNRGSARLAAAAGALVLAGLGLGAPGIAHPHEDGDSAERKVEKVIILREGEDGPRDGKGDRVRRFHVERGGDHDGKHVRTIRIEGDGDHDGKGKPVRTFHIERHGDHGKDGGRHVRAFRIDGDNMIDCDGEKTEVDESTGGERERTRVVICGKGDLNAAQRIERLEQALGRINANQELSVEHKEKVTAALREAMERLRATP